MAPSALLERRMGRVLLKMELFAISKRAERASLLVWKYSFP